MLPGMQSAFIDIGGERAAFLHVADIWGSRHNGDGAGTPIERLLTEGQSLMVQVVKDPIGTKGARLSTQISIAGRLLVYLPQESHIGISQRIDDEEERQQSAREAAAAAAAGGERRLHHPHHGRDGQRSASSNSTSRICASSGTESRSGAQTPRRSRCSTRI